MKREIYLIDNFYRLDEILAQMREAHQQGEPLAVGFYKAKRAAAPAPGIEVFVTPEFLRPHILSLMEEGQFAPLENGLFLWAGPEAGAELPWKLAKGGQPKHSPLAKWLLLGLNSTGVGKNGLQVASEPMSAVEHVREFLNTMFKNILELRPSMVVFLFDVKAFSYHLQQYGVSASDNDIFNEVLSWLVEDCLHPKLSIFFKTDSDFKKASQAAHAMVGQKRIAREVTFGF